MRQRGTSGESSARFRIYDELIDGIPPDLRIERCVVGMHWIAIDTAGGLGLSMAPIEGERQSPLAGTIAGRRVREVAQWAKSWNALEASIGVAAINAWHNRRASVEACFGPIDHLLSTTSVFSEIGPVVAGRKVTVIGHFPDLDQLDPICTLSILERKPLAGDYPDPACEYILPEQEFVFMTGVTLINKTLPRLLELSRNARVVLVGPSVPLSPVLFAHGVSLLAGTVVRDATKVFNHIMEGGDRSIFKNGASTIRLERERALSGQAQATALGA